MEPMEVFFMDTFPIAAGFLLPHPPIMVPEVGREDRAAAATVAAAEAVADEVARIAPDAIVFVSPHAPNFADWIFCYGGVELEGDLRQFGADQVTLGASADRELLEAVTERFRAAGLPGGTLEDRDLKRLSIGTRLDHGVLVPLYFIAKKARGFRMVAMSSSGLELPQVYRAGTAVREAAEALGRRVVFVASGDLSHKVSAKSHYGASREGPIFDAALCEAWKAADLPALLSIDHEVREGAAECGYRSVVALCGAFDGIAGETRLYSYEAPYGIGYGVASMRAKAGAPPVRNAMEAALDVHRKTSAERSRSASPQVEIARATLEAYVREGRRMRAEDFDRFRNVLGLFDRKAGVFVSLKKFGALRGCIGTTAPTTPSVAAEIVRNAVHAGTEDPRFEPVRPDELDYLDCSVDVLEPAKPIASREELDPKAWGVIVRKGGRSGLLLPDLEGVDTVEEQLDIACRKAGIDPSSDYAIEKFAVTRYR
jgi:AmmeMemoRadiSam system protein A